MIWWWVAAAVIFLVVIPLVVVLANRLVRLAGEVHDYARDVRVHVEAITANLESLPVLAETAALASSLSSPDGPLRRLLERDT